MSLTAAFFVFCEILLRLRSVTFARQQKHRLKALFGDADGELEALLEHTVSPGVRLECIEQFFNDQRGHVLVEGMRQRVGITRLESLAGSLLAPAGIGLEVITVDDSSEIVADLTETYYPPLVSGDSDWNAHATKPLKVRLLYIS